MFYQITSRQSVAFVALLSMVFVLTACKSERSSPTEPLPDVQLFGFVRGTDGLPVSDVAVSIGTRTASSDSNGRYRLTGLSTGSRTVTAKKAGFQDFTKTVNLDLSPGNQLDITLVSTGGTGGTGVITGDVRADGAPLFGVTITSGGSAATTAIDGTFTLTGLTSGTVTLTAHKDGFSDVTVQANVGAQVHITLTRATVSPATLSGTVTAGGAPVSGAVVSAQGQTATTLADGTYSLTSLIAGTATVQVTKAGFINLQRDLTLAAGSNTLDLALSAAGTATLSGQVTSAGTPIAGAAVSIQGKSGTTDTNGNYSITGLNTGNANVTVTKSGFATATQAVSLIDGVNTKNVSLSPQASGTAGLSGTITNSTGGPLAGATIAVQSKTATSAADGTYAISDLTTGPASVSVSKTGFQTKTQQVTLAVGANTLNVSLTATASGVTLSGTVTFNGTPIAGVTVTAQVASVVTGNDGTYRFTDLTAGATTVTARKSGFQDVRQSVTLISGDNVLNLTLVAAPGSSLLAGTVSSGGSTLAGVTLTVQGQTTTSNADGTYLFTGLLPGRVTVTAAKGGFQNFQTTITLVSGTNNLDIDLTSSGGTTLSGQVVSVDGPLPGVTVTVQGLTSVSTDNGQYGIAGLKTGSTVVLAQKIGFQDFRQTVTLVAGDNALLIELTSGAGTLSGRVTTGIGAAAVAGATVSAQGQTAVSATDGSYLLSNLTAGTASVTVTKTGFTNFQKSITLVAGPNTLNISLARASARLSNSAGSGIPAVQVSEILAAREPDRTRKDVWPHVGEAIGSALSSMFVTVWEQDFSRGVNRGAAGSR